MKIIERKLQSKLLQLEKKYPVVTLTGPRQSGKTTLVKSCFPEKKYISLENPDVKQFAEEDPRAFLESYKDGVIFDEVQRVPELLSYIQTIVDEKNKNGQYILTGSQNFLLLQSISQSLAGRTAILHLLPFGLNELSLKNAPNNPEQMILKGFYPRIYNKNLNANQWYNDYISTYLDRDVRLIKNIGDLKSFHIFLKLCAGRSGQILNLSGLASDCGISHVTAKSWLSILETSFIIYEVVPYYKNFNKRLIKAPKMYFYDTGLLCALLGISNPKDLMNSPFRGPIFETFVMSELHKYYYHSGQQPNIYYWRDRTGHEVDILIDSSKGMKLAEVKSCKTINSDFFKNLNYLSNFLLPTMKYIVYAGNEKQKRSQINIIPWFNADEIAEK